MTSRIVNRVPLLQEPSRVRHDIRIYGYDPIAELFAQIEDGNQRLEHRKVWGPSEPVLIGKTWKARLRDWGELAVMGILSALILLLGTTLGLLIYSLIREIA
ncbi:hypothetical protein SEA_BEARBQ_96 [Gordonia phage BearBQ]|nr:hypothetical protein SEA_BEARBQ_96 [Gordonia phage BearBQ]